ncbi:MAG: GGDEF domain-containing protein [Pseudomonadota bacterium]
MHTSDTKASLLRPWRGDLLVALSLTVMIVVLGLQAWSEFRKAQATLAESSVQRAAAMLVSEVQILQRQGLLLKRSIPTLVDDFLRMGDDRVAHAQLDLLMSEWFEHYQEVSFLPHDECTARLVPELARHCADIASAAEPIVELRRQEQAMSIMMRLGEPGDMFVLVVHQSSAPFDDVLRAFSLAGQRAGLYAPEELPGAGMVLASVKVPDSPWVLGVSADPRIWEQQSGQITHRVVAAITVVTLITIAITLLRLRAARAQMHGQALEAVNQQLYEQATHDALTGLYNRYAFNEHFQRISRQLQRENEPLGLLLIDIDYFKQVNDHWGHEAGDELLRKLAEVIGQRARRPLDMAARLGGEEFVVLLEGVAAEDAWALGELLRVHVVDLALPHPTRGHVSVSVGVSSSGPGPMPGLKDLLEQADRALYAAKGGGRDRVVGAWEVLE